MNAPTVLIVGAGPVGAAAALALSQQGLDVTLLDVAQKPNDQPRAAVYLHTLLPDFDRLGILDDMKALGLVDRGGFNIRLIALDEKLSAPLSEIDDLTPTPFNIHMGQGEFTGIVLRHLERRGVDVRWGRRVGGLVQDSDGVTVSATADDGTTETYRADWVVGADGGRSDVRELIGATLDGSTWDERFVATNLHGDLRSRGFNSSNLYIHPTLACVVAAIDANDLWRCTFQEDESLPLDGIEDRIWTFYRELFGPDLEIDLVAYQPYRMHQRMASTMRENRVLLIGDAAHLTNPTGGLGLTTGLYDVLALEEVLPAVAFGRADEVVLDRWSSDRTRVFTEITSPRATELKRLVYGGLGADELREASEGPRRLTATHEGRVEMLMNLDDLRSPSLLADQR